LGAGLCRQWLALEAQRNRLLMQWGRLEAALARQHRWYDLSAAQQTALPTADEFRRVDARLDVLAVESDRLLSAIPAEPATNLVAVVGKLIVVAEYLGAQDHPLAHTLILRASEDLIALARERGSAP
jgi:hypothetical protein